MSLIHLNNVYRSVIDLSRRLIDIYPTYDRPDSQKDAQLLIKSLLDSEGWNTSLDCFLINDIKSKSLIQKPWEYDAYYQNCSNISKCNLYAVFDTGTPGSTLILNGHVDVDILDKHKNQTYASHINRSEIRGDRLYGRGSSDMLVGLSCLAHALALSKRHIKKGKLIFISVIDEEIGGNGSLRACEWLRENQYISKLNNSIEVIIAEPTENFFCTSTMSFLPFEFHICSENMHMNIEANNGLERLTHLFRCIQNFKEKHASLNLNIGVIEGGCDPSLPIPDLFVKGVMSAGSNYSVEYLKRELSDCLGLTNIRHANFIIEASQSHKIKFGSKLKSTVFNSACDASVFQSFGYPTGIFGPGSLQQAHTNDEFIELGNVREYLKKLKYELFTYFNEEKSRDNEYRV